VRIGARRGAVGLLALLVLALPSSAAADAGDLDTTFSNDGKVLTNATAGYDYAFSLVVLPDGKIVTAGPASGGRGRFSVIRYNSDGTLDTGFGGTGIVFTNFTRRIDEAYDVALWQDKYLVAGTAAAPDGRFALARYNDDGTLDTSFGGDGKVVTDLSPGNDFAFNVAVQSDDKIVAAGHQQRQGGRFAVVRYNGDGSLDTTFSGDGKAFVNFTDFMDHADDLALNDDGTILLAGPAAENGRNGRFALARFEADGDPDPTFSGDGKLTTDLTPGFDAAFGVVIQPDEKIVAVGQGGQRMGLARYGPTGTLDPTFGGDGIVRTDFSPRGDLADEVALTAGGGIFVAGVAGLGVHDTKFAVALYTATGALDTTFSVDGRVKTNMTPRFDYALDAEIDPSSDKLVVAGIAADGLKSGVARYLTEN
jgi:uncharacterized delta-60 repeat protein